MATFALALILILASALGLAVGVAAGRKPIRGSCGGIACRGACAGCPKREGDQR